MTTLCFLTWTNGRLSKEIQAEEQAWQQSGGKHGASEVPVFHSMTFRYTGCKVNKSGFRREMWVSLHRRTVGNKRKEWTSLLGKSKEIENIQIGSGNSPYRWWRSSEGSRERAVDRRMELQKQELSNQDMSDSGDAEKCLVGKGLERDCWLWPWKKIFHGTLWGSILKSRDITLPTKVRLVKAMVFPVVMYGCESWTINKAEHRRTDAFKLWYWRRLLSPLDCKDFKPWS